MVTNVKSAFALLLTKVTKPSGEIYGSKGVIICGSLSRAILRDVFYGNLYIEKLQRITNMKLGNNKI